MSKPTLRQAFLLLTNKSAEPIIQLYHDIRNSAHELGNAFLIYHATSEDIPEEIKNINHHSFTNDILRTLNYIPYRQTLIPGSNHFPLLQFFLQNPTYDYYWYIEDDVRFNGDWNYLFNFFTECPEQPDLITCHIRTCQDEPEWPYYVALAHPSKFIPFFLRIRSFNPIFRISRSALFHLHYLLADKWSGHHEVLMPTLLYLEGFNIMDFGGAGPWVKPGYENKFYISADPDIIGEVKTGTVRFRPVIEEAMTEKNKLYHPVKIQSY